MRRPLLSAALCLVPFAVLAASPQTVTLDCAKHDLRRLPHHGQEGPRKGDGRGQCQSRSRHQNRNGDFRSRQGRRHSADQRDGESGLSG